MSNEERPQGGIHLNAGFGSLNASTPREVGTAPRFELLVVGAFGAPEACLCDLTHEDIASTLAAHGAVVAFDVPNHLGSEPPSLAIELPIRTLRDLDPAALASHVPAIVMAEAIAAEVARTGSLAGLDAEAKGPRFDKLTGTLAALQPAPRSPSGGTAPVDDKSLDGLLAMVELPGASKGADPADAAISAFVASTRSQPAAPAARFGVADNQAIARQLEAIATHPARLAAEAAWRGLKLVLSARGRGTRPAIKLWDIGRADITDALASDAFLATLAEGAEAARWGAILVLGAFGASAPDLEALRRLALLGFARQTPVVVSLDADFFGRPAAEVAALDNPAALLEGSAHSAWRGLRARPESQYLFACWNDVVLRAGEGEAPLWGDAGTVVAAQILASLSRTGWPTEILGSQNPVEGLDVVEAVVRGGKTIALPLRAPLDGGTARDLARDGLIALTARADRDQAWLVRAAAVHQYGAVTDEMKAAMESFAGLPFRFVSGLLETVSREQLEALPRHASDADAAILIEQALADLLQTTGPGAAVHVAPVRPSGEEARAFEVSVTLGREVMGGFGFSFDIEA